MNQTCLSNISHECLLILEAQSVALDCLLGALADLVLFYHGQHFWCFVIYAALAFLWDKNTWSGLYIIIYCIMCSVAVFISVCLFIYFIIISFSLLFHFLCWVPLALFLFCCMPALVTEMMDEYAVKEDEQPV